MSSLSVKVIIAAVATALLLLLALFLAWAWSPSRIVPTSPAVPEVPANEMTADLLPDKPRVASDSRPNTSLSDANARMSPEQAQNIFDFVATQQWPINELWRVYQLNSAPNADVSHLLVTTSDWRQQFTDEILDPKRDLPTISSIDQTIDSLPSSLQVTRLFWMKARYDTNNGHDNPEIIGSWIRAVQCARLMGTCDLAVGVYASYANEQKILIEFGQWLSRPSTPKAIRKLAADGLRDIGVNTRPLSQCVTGEVELFLQSIEKLPRQEAVQVLMNSGVSIGSEDDIDIQRLRDDTIAYRAKIMVWVNDAEQSDEAFPDEPLPNNQIVSQWMPRFAELLRQKGKTATQFHSLVEELRK